MMTRPHLLATAVLFALCLGCQKGAIQVASINSVSGFSLQNSLIVFGTHTPSSFTVNGNCNNQVSSIAVSTDSVNWSQLPLINQPASSINCSTTGQFSFQFSAVTQPQFAIPSTLSRTTIYFRGNGPLGYTAVIPLTLAMTESTDATTAGSNVQTSSGGYTLRSRIVATPKTTSDHYTIGR